MAFFAQPLQTPNPIYRPIQWITKQTSVNVIERAIPTITVNAVAYVLPPIPYDATLSTGNDYYFYIDAQTIAQLSTAPTTSVMSSIFNGFGVSEINLNPDNFATISISVTYLYRNTTTGLLTALGVTDASGTVYGLNSTPQHGSDLDYADYKPFFNDTTKLWMSQYPNYAPVSLTDNAWLSCLVTGITDRIRITTYNAAGGVIQTGTFASDTSANFEFETVACGVPNLTAQVYLTGAVNILNPLVDTYSVELIAAAFPVPYLQVRYFKIVDTCGTAIRLHWMGLLSGVESYTFTSKERVSITAQNSTAQRTLSWATTAPQNAINNKGRFKIGSVGTVIYEAISDFLSDDDAIWLRSLLTSPEVYMETTEGLVSIVITTDNAITKTMDGIQKVQFIVNFVLSTNIISQTN